MGGRAVEGTGLENRQTWKRFVGSNPTPSAIFLDDTVQWRSKSPTKERDSELSLTNNERETFGAWGISFLSRLPCLYHRITGQALEHKGPKCGEA